MGTYEITYELVGNGDGRRARILCKYDAVRGDEVAVWSGEHVRVVEQREGRCFVVKACADGGRCISGWVPDYIVESSERRSGSSESIEGKRWWRHRRPRSSSPRNASAPSPLSVVAPAPHLHRISSLIQSLRSSSPAQAPASNQALSKVPLHKKPSFVVPLHHTQAPEHGAVDLLCQAVGAGTEDPEGSLMFLWSGPALSEDASPTNADRINQKNPGNGVSLLTITDVQVADAGQYSPPEEPGQPTVPELNGTTIRLVWAPPTKTGGAAAVWYSVLYRTEDMEDFEIAIDCTRSVNIVVDDLQPGRTYWFRIRAYNEAFVGPPSPPSKPVVVPGALLAVEEEEDSAHSSRATSTSDAATGALAQSNWSLSAKQETQSPPTPEWHTDFEERFKVFSDAGCGRFAVVKQAYGRASFAPIAVKTFQRKDVARETVEREWSILMQLKHKNIIPAGVLFENERQFMLLLQWVPGPPLFEFICQSGQYDENVAQKFMRQLFDALAYLHNLEFAHLDIKPENLLVDPTKSESRLILIDFGDAVCFKSQSATEVRLPYYQGNIEYAAPEQLDSKPLSCATDLWSSGVLAYVLLSGLSPFLDETVEETRRNMLSLNYTFPADRFDSISTSAHELIERLLVLEPGGRLPASECLKQTWFEQDLSQCKELPIDRLSQYISHRRYQATKRNYLMPL